MTADLGKILESMGLGFVGGVAMYPDVPKDLHIKEDALVFTENGSSAKVEGRVGYTVPLTAEQKAALERELT